MKKLLTFIIAMIFTLSIAACSNENQAISQTSDNPDNNITASESSENNIKNNWGITLLAKDITPTGMTLVVEQSGGNPTGNLHFGSEYSLEVMHNEKWETVPYAVKGNIAWTNEAYIVSMNDSTETIIDWEYIYGSLSSGTYRINKSFMDFRGAGDYDTQTLSLQFEIK